MIHTLKTATLAFALMGLFAGCSQEIGDDCGSNAECGPGRVCDLNSRDGYCTISPCERGSCPDKSICVEFINGESYCMKSCKGNGDCRGGYVCDQEMGPGAYCRAR